MFYLTLYLQINPLQRFREKHMLILSKFQILIYIDSK